MTRTLKQFAFGSLYLAILILIAFGVSLLKPAPTCTDNKQNQKETAVDCGGPCVPCETKNLILTAEEVKIFPAGKNQATFLAKVRNPSQKFSASFDYQFELSGAFLGQTQKIRGRESIKPASSEYIVVPGFSISAESIRSAELKVSELQWAEDKSPRSSIKINSQTSIDKNKVTVTGTLFNESAENLPLVNLTAIIFNQQGGILNASVAQLEKVQAFSQKQFTIFFPEVEGLIENLDPQKTEIQWDLNE